MKRVKTIKFVKEYYSQKPLQCILLVALLLRLVAAFFAKGFGMFDDHFLIIESAGSFSDGSDYNNWLPTSPGNMGPQGHNFFYTGLHYFLFAFLNAVGITSPDIKMYFVRIIHAVYSLSIVYFGYKIVFKYAGQKIASQTAWLLAALWVMPWLSVRNLVEIHCIPFLLWGTWIYLKKDNPTIKAIILSGLISGIAFSIRYQVIFFYCGFGLALLFLKQYRNAIIWGLSTLFMMFFIQGGIDLFIWGKPCVEFYQYVQYNLHAADQYLTGGVLKYVYVIIGILIPPVSLFLFYGFFARWRKYLLLFLPSFVFLLFHSLFLNKQERFIFTIIPSIIIVGMIGWNEVMLKKSHVKWLKSFVKGSWIFFIIINTLLLSLITVHYSKKARIETMLYLSKYDNISSIATTSNISLLPLFYLGQWTDRSEIRVENIGEDAKHLLQIEKEPSFVIISEDTNSNKIVDSLLVYFPNLVYETKVSPNFIDAMLHKMNHHNKNETFLIYRNKKQYPQKAK